MTAFSAAIDAIFTDQNLAVDATWWPAIGGPSIPCRIILARPDLMNGFGEAQIVSDTVRIDVRVSEVGDPTRDDRVTIGTENFTLQGEPRRDRLRLVWQCEVIPAC